MRITRAIAVTALALLSVAVPAAQTGRVLPVPAEAFVEPSPEFLRGLTLAPAPRAKVRSAARTALQPPAVGDRRLWPALDRANPALYMKYFTLRAVGSHIEVWVASDQDGVSKGLEFPAGDCRNDDRVQLTDAQVQLLVQAFDGSIYPKEAQAFSVPQPRDGSAAEIPRRMGLPADYYAGDGNRVVALVDNIRDPGFFDVNVRVGVAGVFIPSLDEQVDRNVITIDGVDWLHRTGPNPPHDPVPGDLCRSRAGHPFLIEAIFAHEYQHLLESFQDSDEVAWVNEGLSMYAEAVTGYSELRRPITEVGYSSSVQCMLGYGVVQSNANPNPTPGGPENSLTLWGDRGDTQILCDYGAAETFMHYLAERYGLGFISSLHRDRDNGLASLRKLARGARSDAASVLHDWAAMLALDGVLDRGARLSGGAAARYRTSTLDGGINWSNPDAYRRPGAPPNGSDYVRLAARNRAFMPSSRVRSISFDGSAAFPRRPVEWQVDRNPVDHTGDAALHSGGGGGLDRGIVRRVRVPSGRPRLTFETRYDLAPGLDFALVQVSTNGGRTWRSLPGSLTTRAAEPSALPHIVRKLPGLTGRSGGGPFPAWTSASYDLSSYRGRTVLLALRYLSDARVAFPGWWVDDVRLGGTVLSTGSLSGWRSLSQIDNERIGGFTVQLLGYRSSGTPRAYIHRLRLDSRLRGGLSGARLRRLLAPGYDVVAAIVTYDDETEGKTRYAPYVLRVNGVIQAGGRAG
jgi:hypothetical protein